MGGSFQRSSPENIWTLDGGRTLGWELAEAFAKSENDPPSWLFVQVGGGALASSVVQGLQEACDFKMLTTCPASALSRLKDVPP